MDIVHYLYSHYPRLKRELIDAHMSISPQAFLERVLKSTTIYSLLIAVLSAFLLVNRGYPAFLGVFVFPVVFFLMLNMQMQIPKVAIRRRGKEMNKDALFAGRYLLIKVASGKPLLNALIDASQSYGIASKYFKEIVDNVTFGTPIEQAIEQAQEGCPSPSFKKLLFQIHSALTTGTDITRSLQNTIDEIESEQSIEIERYGKKLASLAMFYMLLAIIVPSLGLTIFVVVAGLVGLPIDNMLYVVLVIFLMLSQLFFISLFKSIRPAVNL